MGFRGVNRRRAVPFSRRVTSNAGNVSLSFSLANFTNASDRYVYSKNPTSGLYEVTGPFAGGTLATKSIGGKNYAQIFGPVTEDINFTDMIENAENAQWVEFNCDVTPNQINSPIGTLTADLVYATGSGSINHSKRANTIPAAAGEPNIFGVFVKNNNAGGIIIEAFISGQHGVKFRFSDNTIYNTFGANLTDYGAWNLGGDWFFIWICYTHPSGGNIYRTYEILDSSLQAYYEQSGESYYVWGGTDELNARYPSYLKLVKQAYAKDVLIWPVADVPNWLKGSQNQAFSFNIMPYHSSTQLAAVGTKKYLFSVDGTENIECYLDGADNKIKIDVDTVNKFSSTAKTWDAFDSPKISIIPNDGSNCRVISSGFDSGNGDETGTIFSMQTDGDLSCASMHTTDDQQFDGLISEFRKGLG